MWSLCFALGGFKVSLPFQLASAWLGGLRGAFVLLLRLLYFVSLLFVLGLLICGWIATCLWLS